MYGYGGFGPYGGGPGGPGPMFGGPFGGPPVVGGGIIDDSEIAAYVRDNIDLDPYISVRDKNTIDVDVSGGVATLSGMVQSRRSKGLAYADAFWSAGVLDVVNNLKVNEPPRPSAEEEVG